MKKLALLFALSIVFISCQDENSKKYRTWNVVESNYDLTIESIDSEQFYTQQSLAPENIYSTERIYDFEVAKPMLKGIVEFTESESESDEEYPTQYLRRILFKNGDKYTDKYQENYFNAYFPYENILLFSSEGSEDISFNLENGKRTNEIGNPNYIVYSPNKKFRLNGYSNGYSNGDYCVTYFIQKLENGKYEYVIPLSESFVAPDQAFLCQVSDIFWADDNTLYLKELIHFADSEDLVYNYYKIIINNADLGNYFAEPVITSEDPKDFIPNNYNVFKKDANPGVVEQDMIHDLDNDGLADLVLLIKDTDSDNIVNDGIRGKIDRNRRGIIILFYRGDYYELASKNYDCFSSENEDDDTYKAPKLLVGFDNGDLVINYLNGEYGYWNYTFRYQNNDFELIEYFSTTSNNGGIVDKSTTINFLSKKRALVVNMNEDAQVSGDEIFQEIITDIQVNRLLRLSEIINFDELEISNLYQE